MQRRQVLASVVSLSSIPLAGCSVLRPEPLSGGEPVAEAGRTWFDFEHDGARAATITLQHGGDSPSDAGAVPFRVSIWHRDGWRTTSIRLRLRSPPTGTDLPAPLYLKRPSGHPFPEIHFTRDGDDFTTILEIEEMGVQGRGSSTLEFLLRPHERRPTRELLFDARTTFRGETFDRRYVADGRSTVTLGARSTDD